MPASRGFLDRFRASGTPGAAAGAGVPADRVAERNVELAPVFEQLSDTEAEARRIRSEAADAAATRRDSAAEESRRLVSTARRDAESVRRDAASRIAARAERETAATLQAAQADAAAIRAHVESTLPSYTDRVVALVLDRLDLRVEQPGSPSDPRPVSSP
jgi:hypothetical protein